jgi:uncharacterized protein YkwD/uncharacterized protein YraI
VPTRRALPRSIRAALALATVAAAVAGPVTLAAPEGAAFCADPEEAQFLELINDYRAENGLQPLGFSRALSAAAEFHSDHMAATGYFAHTMSDGTTVEQNVRNHGYRDGTFGENIAAGVETAELAFQTWQNSASHNQNMLRPAFGAIGISRVHDGGSGYGWYWTTIFGGSLDERAEVCGESGRRARTVDDVNLRRGPGNQHDVKQAVLAGVELPVAGEPVDGYLPVDHDGETVWVALEFVAVDEAAGTTPDATWPAPQPPATVTETVNLRAEPSRESTVLAMIPAGEAIDLSGEEANGYLGASWQGTVGWVDGAYVAGDPASTAAPEADPAGLGGVTATAIDALNLRAAPSREGAVLTVVPAGAELLLTGNRDGGYFEVRFGDLTAWADAAYLRP